MSTDSAPAHRKGILAIIWAGMVAALVTSWIVNLFMRNMITTSDSGSTAVTSLVPFLPMMLWAGVQGLVSWWLNVTKNKVAHRLKSAAQLSPLTDQERTILQIRLQAAAVVWLSSAEIPALIGLVATFLHVPYPHTFELLALVSLIQMIVFRLYEFPKIGVLIDRLEPQFR